MSTTHYKEDMRRWFDALNKKDQHLLDTMADELFATEYVLHDPGFPNSLPGPAGVRQMTRKILTDSSPDMSVSLDDVLIDGDKGAIRLTVRDTDRATGKPIMFTVLNVCHFSGGKIAEEWELVQTPV